MNKIVKITARILFEVVIVVSLIGIGYTQGLKKAMTKYAEDYEMLAQRYEDLKIEYQDLYQRCLPYVKTVVWH